MHCSNLLQAPGPLGRLAIFVFRHELGCHLRGRPSFPFQGGSKTADVFFQGLPTAIDHIPRLRDAETIWAAACGQCCEILCSHVNIARYPAGAACVCLTCCQGCCSTPLPKLRLATTPENTRTKNMHSYKVPGPDTDTFAANVSGRCALQICTTHLFSVIKENDYLIILSYF